MVIKRTSCCVIKNCYVFPTQYFIKISQSTRFISLNSITGLIFVMITGCMVCEAETELLGAFAKFRKVTINFVMSTCLPVRLAACNKSPPGGRISINFDIRKFFENMSRRLKFH